MNRLLDGQFDQCGITLQELHDVEESLVKSLTAVYHGRVRYPEQKRLDMSVRSGPSRPPHFEFAFKTRRSRHQCTAPLAGGSKAASNTRSVRFCKASELCGLMFLWRCGG